MKNILSLAKRIYNKIVYSIAFYPVLISAAFFLLAWISLFIEDFEIVNTFKKNVPHLIIQDRETARVILATLVGSILSLTVFSFTMVMVVLNQASANFSPRLLPGLISSKGHQIILGIYIGTLTYCMIILISLGAYGVDSTSFGLSTMLAALFGVICVGLFVSFINSISKAIQIHNIIDRVTRYSADNLSQQLEQKAYKEPYGENDHRHIGQVLKMKSTGYYRGFDLSLISDKLLQKAILLEILPFEDEHLWEGAPLLAIVGNLEEEDEKAIRLGFQISANREEGNSSMGGMIQLMEVAVKAMSPGINDPGTAINVINRLGVLMSTALQVPDKIYITNDDHPLKIIGNTISCETLMASIVQPIRHYSKKDSSVVTELAKALKFMKSNANITEHKRRIVSLELAALQRDVELYMDNERDRDKVVARIQDER